MPNDARSRRPAPERLRTARGGGSLKPLDKDRAGLAARQGESPERNRSVQEPLPMQETIAGKEFYQAKCQTQANVPRRRKTGELKGPTARVVLSVLISW